MTVEYNFNIYDTANDKVVPGVLATEIEASSITTELSHVNTDGEDINIYFSSALSSQEETTLSGVVSEHLGVASEDRHNPARHAHNFTALFDTPVTYSGAAPNAVKVNEIETGLAFIEDDLTTSWHRNPLYNGEVVLAGWYFETLSDESLSSGEIKNFYEECENSFVALNITAISGAPFNITVSGTSSNDFTKSYEEISENITVTGTGYYRSTHRFLGSPYFSIVEDNKYCMFDPKRYSMYNFNFSKVTLTRLELEWLPDGQDWGIELHVHHLCSDGHKHLIDSLTFDNSDLFVRSGLENPGVFSASGYNHAIDGSKGEGVIITVNQFFIGELSLILWYREVI